MKKIIAFLLALTIIFSFTACSLKDKDNIGEKNPNEIIDKQKEAKGSIIYGSTIELSGSNFFTTMWGDNIADKIVRDLIHGYETVVYKKETSSYDINKTVVKNFRTIENDDGTKTFKIELYDDLVYSDGSSITAKDYVFSILLSSHPEMAEIGARIDEFSHLVGFDEYSNGPEGSEEGQIFNFFAGVRLLDDYKFSLKVKKSELPYFYEIIYAKVFPYPMAIIAPNADIIDEGNGAKIIGEFSSEILEKTINDTETGYRFNPKVTSGPYVLDVFDKGDQLSALKNNTYQISKETLSCFNGKIAVLKYNHNFKGDYNGQKARIAQIVIGGVLQSNQIDNLVAGNIDVISAVSGKKFIEQGLSAVNDDGNISMLKFPRAGYGKLSFACDIGATQFIKVRQAIAYCIDTSELIRNYSDEYAKPIYGMYGLAQWMYKENKDVIENEFNKYSFNLEKAKELLIEDGWILNAEGDKFVEGIDDIRYKMYDGKLMPLEIKHLAPKDSPISELLSTKLSDSLKSVGMKYEQTVVELPVLQKYMRTYALERQYNMINLATNFSAVFDPYYSYHTDEQYMGVSNTNFIKDDNLMNLADEMRKVSSSDKELYSKKWLEFQRKCNELLPDVPLYSDEYHVFFSSKLKNYEIDAFWQFQQAILYSYIEE